MAAAPVAARADEGGPARRWGIGTSVGSGLIFSLNWAWLTSSSVTLFLEAAHSQRLSRPGYYWSDSFLFLPIVLPSLEVRSFFKNGHSIDVRVPVTNTAAFAALWRLFSIQADVFYNFNFGRGSVRGLFAPGLGVSFLAGRTIVGGGLRVPFLFGVEFLRRARDFGFQLRAGPIFEVALASDRGHPVDAYSVGAMLELGFLYYRTTNSGR